MMTLGEQRAVLQLVRDRDCALASFEAMALALSRAVDRLLELDDEDGIAALRAILGEHFEVAA